jgi:urease beta subunit
MFEHKGVTHYREVNACLDEDGAYDEEATAARVVDVARGVAVKIELGVIVNASLEGVSEPV